MLRVILDSSETWARQGHILAIDIQLKRNSGKAELIIAKQRNGPIGEIPLTFLKEFTRFEVQAYEHEPS